MNNHDKKISAPSSTAERRVRRGVVRIATIVAAAGLLAVGVPTAANASTPSNCSNMVCLYDSNGALAGTYQDVTDDWQYFDRVRTASAASGTASVAVGRRPWSVSIP